MPYANSLRPGSNTTSVDAAGNTLTSVYIADYTYAGIDAYAYYTGTPALYGSSNSSTGKGVYGNASAATGTNYGVYGRAASHDGFGVYGLKEGGSNLFASLAPSGVWGDTNNGNGVVGTTSADNMVGVYGRASGTGGSVGVLGNNSNSTGTEVYADSMGIGVYASVPAGHVGLGTNGTKPAVVRTEDGSRLLYSEEATQVWFADYGFGKLKGGVATIPIDPVFAQTVNLQEPYHVFVQVYGDADVYVSNRTPTQFEVHLRGVGDPNVEFAYRIVALRLGARRSGWPLLHGLKMIPIFTRRNRAQGLNPAQILLAAQCRQLSRACMVKGSNGPGDTNKEMA